MAEQVTPDWLKAALLALLAVHKRDQEEPLLAALVYTEDGQPVVLEVVRGFGSAQGSDDADFVAVAFGRADGFPIPADKSASFRFTNPKELAKAIEDRWPVITRLRAAQAQGRVEILEPAEDPAVAHLLNDALGAAA